MNFKEQLDRKRAAAKSGPQSKPVSEMSEAELATEEARLQAEIRRHREQAVLAGREAVADESGGSNRALGAFLASRRRQRKAPWK